MAAYHRRYIIIMFFFQRKNVSFVIYLSLSRPLSPFFSFSCAGLPPTFSFSLSFSCSISKFVDMTINLSLILQTTRIQKQFPLSVFVFSVTLKLSLLYKTQVAMRFPAKTTSSCIWVAIPDPELLPPPGISPRGEIPRRHPSISRVY